jgi:hypothetical protein
LVKTILFLFVVFAAAPRIAEAATIKALQKRIKKDRKDILFYLTRIKDEQARLKTDKAKVAKYSGHADIDPPVQDGPVTIDGKSPEELEADKWKARAAKESASIASDRASQEKAQKDLGQANSQLDKILKH